MGDYSGRFPDPDPVARIADTLERAERGHRARVKATVLALAVVGLFTGGFATSFAAKTSAPAPRPDPAQTQAAAAPAAPVLAAIASTPPPEVPQAVVSTPPAATPRRRPRPQKVAVAQSFDIRIGSRGYEPSVVSAAAGRRIELTVGRGEGCAAGFLMPSLGIDKDNSSGPVSFSVGALKPGTYRFTCGMGMVEGKLIVR